MQQQCFYTPHPSLRNYIRYFWTFGQHVPTPNDIPLRIMADRFPKLILQNGMGESGIKKSNQEALPVSFVSGIITKPRTYRISKDYSHLGISFQPDALKHIFKVKSDELTDTFLDISSLIPQHFYSVLMEAETVQEKVTLLTRYFLERIAESTYNENHTVVKNVLSDTDRYQWLTVKAIAGEHGLSERSVERKFMDFVGISPKRYLQLYRFEHTYKSLSLNDFNSLAEIGYMNGYADQSHFIRNFKEYSGMLPTTYIDELKKEKDGQEVLIWNYTKGDQ